MIRTERGRRGAELGQTLPMMALFGAVMLGCMAIATDLSLSTHFKRNLENVTDAAALAGARQLPSSPATSDEQNAVQIALQVVHNSYPWVVSGSTWAHDLVTANHACDDGRCSVTVCAGLTPSSGSCSASPSRGSNHAFWLTVSAPPRTASVAAYNGDRHRVEVVMHEDSEALFARIFSVGQDQDGAHSLAYHFAAAQPFPFALYAQAQIYSGNSSEIINGNVYAARYLAPQSNGHAAICAAADPSGNPGFVVLGAPQGDDAGYQNDGQYNNSAVPPNADPVTEGASCASATGGTVGMSASPSDSAGCATAYPGNNSGANITYDSVDHACEANPALHAPTPAALPKLPVYAQTVCNAAGISGGIYQPGEYACASGAAMNITTTALAAGVYEIDAGASTGGCDVVMNGGVTALTGVTFYLKGGAGICLTIPSGTTITQTPYNGGTGDPGDGRYDVLSDNAGNPSLTMNNGGGGSGAGEWSLQGVIWLPTGTVTINNKEALVDSGQVIVNAWNDTSGYHPNPSISYNASMAPAQAEMLDLSE